MATVHRLTRGDSDGEAPGALLPRAAPNGCSADQQRDLYRPHDPDFDPDTPSGGVLSIDAVCFNRDLPADLPFGGGHPELRFVEPMAGVTRVNCLTAPSQPLRPPLREQRFWRLISHLSLGHLSVVGGEEAATALGEVLRLYDMRDSVETRAAIDSLTSVTSKPGSARAPGGKGGAFCRGLDVTLEFDLVLGKRLDLFDGLGPRSFSRHATSIPSSEHALC